MTVQSKARQLAESCRRAMPDARVSIDHSRTWFGESSYVYVTFAVNGGIYEKARVSDHGIGARRYYESDVSLYLTPKSKPDAWAIWLGELQQRYEALGGRLPEPGPLLQLASTGGGDA